ncbi:MAG: hypothetical protein NVSMB47_01090 [Polyangiales bacterium]
MRADEPPEIDGVLDDEIWTSAVKDRSFASTRSKPYGIPTLEPTAVQVAYDEEYLYVAFTCAYSGPGNRDDSFPPDTETLTRYAESVGVGIDAQHDHTNAYTFYVSRSGVRAESEITANGDVVNADWVGIWNSAVDVSPDGWTAELRIPWGTIGLTTREEKFSVGINFRRRVPGPAGVAIWSLAPPAIGPQGMLVPAYYGNLIGLSNLHPGQRLFLAPYVSGVARDQTGPLSPLRDFSRGGGHFNGYGGLYGRVRPFGPLTVDFTINPDFTTVSPDQALTNLSRFELYRPELRPFFLEDLGRFSFGSDREQLFYSRRVGLRLGADGGYDDVPVLYGAKSVMRLRGLELAVMNVGVSTSDPKVSANDQVTVVRGNELFGDGRRFGAIYITRAGDQPLYRAMGVDGTMTFVDQHLILSGYGAGTVSDRRGFTGNGALSWYSQEFRAGVAYFYVDDKFDPQLGFFQQTGIRRETYFAAFVPQIFNDYVREIELRAEVARVRALDESLLLNQGVISATATLLNNAVVEAAVLPSAEEVPADFQLAGQRLTIAKGHYVGMVTRFRVRSAPRERVEAAVGFASGELYDGYQRVPSIDLGLNLGHITASARYKTFYVKTGGVVLVGHQLSGRFLVGYTPRASTVLAIEANTFDPLARAQLLTTYLFGARSSVALVLSQYAQSLETWFSQPRRLALITFTYGFAPF